MKKMTETDVRGQASDTSALEFEIDRLVYQHYDFTEDEPTVAVRKAR